MKTLSAIATAIVIMRKLTAVLNTNAKCEEFNEYILVYPADDR